MTDEIKNTLSDRDSSNLNTNQSVDFEFLDSRLKQIEHRATIIENDLKQNKYEIVTLLGIFVGLITYLGLEIQVFKTINNPLLIIGISMFFIASILLFILCINLIIKKIEQLTWTDFKNPLYAILFILLIISIFFILIGYKDYSDQNSFRIYGFNKYEN